MDKVTHFLLLLCLVLVSLVCLIWLAGASCTSGYFATHNKLPPQFMGTVGGVLDTAGKQYKEVRADLKNIADYAKNKL